ncbi:MAG: polyphosphate glucokinase [Gemmatimonadetes bacterium]|jgi:polyphosphate glucokinase|nr:polyphosphate glucokinase [Gemmatimonadota bacterium]
MKTLVVDIGGTSVKLLATGRRTHRQVPSGPSLTPRAMVRSVLAAVADWPFDAVSVGFPGPAHHDRPLREPVNLGRGWVRFDYEGAFGCPVRLMNDAAMQAVGSYAGGRMLFLGLGTGLGTSLVLDGTVVPMELAHLPYRDGRSYEDVVGDAGLRAAGTARWRRHVTHVVDLLLAATVTEYAVLGGGNVRHFTRMPPRTRRGDNANAFRGGFRLWQERGTWR